MADEDVPATSLETEGRSLSWEGLPDDLWELIFKKIDNGHGALEFISLVCKRFLTTSNRARTYVFISHTTGQFMPLQAPAFYSRFPFIKKICLTCLDPNLNTTITQLAYSTIPLESLTLFSQVRFPKKAMRLLGQHMSKTLRSLSCLFFDILTDDDLAIVADCFSYLHEFDIDSSGCPISSSYSYRSRSGSKHEVTDQGIRQISTKLKSLVSLGIVQQKRLSHRSLDYLASNCTSLRKLRAGVSHGPFSSSICLDRFKRLDFFGSLSSLGLSGLEISKHVLTRLTVQNLKVKELQLDDLEFTYDITGAMFCEFLKSCSSLRQLELESSSFPAHTRAMDIANSIPGIEVIQLRHSYMKVMPPKILFHLFMRCPLLEDLYFNDDCLGIGQEWFKAPPPTSLVRNLSFSCDDLCDETLNAILTICPKLEDLSIYSESKVTLEGVKAAITNCSNIKCLYVNGLYVNGPIELSDFIKAK